MSEWLIRGSLFYSVPSSQHQESFTEHLAGLGETHTGTISGWLGFPFFSHLKAPLWLSVSHYTLEQFLLFHPKETKLERLSQSMEVMFFCAKILGHYVIKVFVWDRNVISQLMGTHDPHHSRGFCPFDSVILISMVNVCDTSCLKVCC